MFSRAARAIRDPRDPQDPAGPSGVDFEYTYVGTKGTPCNHCHANVVADVLLTKHTHAYVDLAAADRENPYCLQCHTTGWDSAVNYGDTEIAVYGPDVNGYDDYWGVDTEQAADRRAELEGVQCEACHGPMGPTFKDHAPPTLTMATVVGPEFPEDIVSPCYPCHSTQFSEDEYPVSGHGTVLDRGLRSRSVPGRVRHARAAATCHTSEGFVKYSDPDYASWTPEEYNLIGCVTCHDPHSGAEGGGNEAQLRKLTAQPVIYNLPYDPDNIPAMDGYGTGQICAQCHHARRDNANVTNQINNGTSRFGPHESPQMDTYIGYGCYEIPGMEYDREHSHQGIEVACVQCHMRRDTVLHGEEVEQHAFHSFAPNTENCLPCHTLAEDDFDYSDGQSEVVALMNELAAKYGYASYEEMVAPSPSADPPGTGWDNRGAGVTVWQREAAYALYFLNADGSKGAHNPEYAKSLLENAIAHYEDNEVPPN